MSEIDFMAAIDSYTADVEAEAPVRRDPFDPACVEDFFNTFAGELERIGEMAEAHQVMDDNTHTIAVDMTGQAKALIGKIEKKRKEVKAPYLSMAQTIDGYCKPLTNRLIEIAAGLTSKIRPYMIEQDRIRKEAQAKAEAEARAAQKKAEDEARAKAEEARAKAQAEADALAAANKTEKVIVPEIIPEAVPVFVPAPIPPQTQTKSEAGTASLKKEWQGVIIDIRALPEACFEARWDQVEKALMPWVNAQIKAGIREIPGVKIREVAKVDVRARR